MKWKLKALAAAIAVVISAPASAAIATSGTGNGEMFFSVWDTVSETSYTRDLGIPIQNWLTGNLPNAAITAPGFTQSFGPDPTLTTWLASVSANLNGLVWNVGAMDGSGQNRYLTTAGAIAPGMINGQLNGLNDGADVFIANTNPLGSHPGTNAVNGSNTASKALDGESAYGGGAQWGANWGGNAVGFVSGALIGASNFFWALAANGGVTATPSFINQFGNANGFSTWTFGTDGTLTFLSPNAVAAIPIPAAVWLLGSGLIGLVGVARRRQSKLA